MNDQDKRLRKAYHARSHPYSLVSFSIGGNGLISQEH